MLVIGGVILLGAFCLWNIGHKLEKAGRRLEEQGRHTPERQPYTDNRVYYTDNRQYNFTENHTHYHVTQEVKEDGQREMGHTTHSAPWGR